MGSAPIEPPTPLGPAADSCGTRPERARKRWAAVASTPVASASVTSAVASAPSAWFWSARARSPARTRLATSCASCCAWLNNSPASAWSMCARAQAQSASRTCAAVRSCAARTRLLVARACASATATVLARSPGSHSGMLMPATISSRPRLWFRRSVLVDSSSATGSAVQRVAACCWAAAASRRICCDRASGWRCQAASKVCFSVVVAATGAAVALWAARASTAHGHQIT